MANEPSKTPTPQPQAIPLSKIHDLPGAMISRQPDKSYGGLVTSIQAGGVKEPVVLRLREDGEYQLVTGYRRRRACELAKLKDIPALVYEMSMPSALNYHRQVKNQPGIPIPGKPVLPAAPDKNGLTADVKGPEKPTTPTAAQDQEKPNQGKDPTQAPAADKAKDGGKPAQEPKPAVAQGEQKPNQGKDPAQTAAPAAADKAKDGDKPTQEPKPAAARGQEKPNQGKDPAQAPAPAADKAKDGAKPAQEPKPAAAQGEQKPNQGKDPAQAPAPAADKAKEGDKPAQEPKPAVAQGEQKPIEGKDPAQTAAPAADKAKDGDKPTQEPKPAAARGQEKPNKGKDPAQAPAPAAADKAKEEDKPTQEPKPVTAQGQEKPSQGKAPAQAPAVTGTAAKGPIGTAISQVLPDRLSPPDEEAKKDFPVPKEGESFSVVLHPAYLEKSDYNTVSVDTKSEDYAELKKSIELNGVKDPVLARIGEKGTLEIISGQRRHMIATELNYPVPTIIQKISDADAKILVADGNLHRPKISAYDLSRTLRMKMEGMKQKAGRRKKGFKAEELYSDTKLAQEMGMPVSKLNRLIRLSEATKDVCDRVDDGSLTLSVASALSFLKPGNQDGVLHLLDLGYKVPAERVEYMKKVEKEGKLNDQTMRDVLDGKNVLDPPQQTAAHAPEPTQPSAPAASAIPPSPDVGHSTPAPDAPAAGRPGQASEGAAPTVPDGPSALTPQAQEGQEPVDGRQERPEYTKVVLAGDRLRKYFPDVMMTPREIEESIYEALEERRQRQQKEKERLTIFPKRGPSR